MNTKKNNLIAAALAALLMSGNAMAADSHTITVNATVTGTCKFNAASSTLNLTLDPTASSTVTQTASVLYRCTKGTAPSFALASGSTGSAAGGNLVNGAESIPYTFSSASGGSGTGMAAGNDKTLSVSVSVNQANAANVTPAVYTDSITITLTP
ncbi:MAG TPA: spore coat protein U domain-containing protein [Burkholderiales bacterium]|nr:spore coat protein U domain-containing protein [Burkholderiales bacterium]